VERGKGLPFAQSTEKKGEKNFTTKKEKETGATDKQSLHKPSESEKPYVIVGRGIPQRGKVAFGGVDQETVRKD